MERMEYDPGGGNFLPVSESEMGSTLMVIGMVMLVAGLGWGLFVEWDLRAGNHFMRFIFGLDIAAALSVAAWGFRKKNHFEKRERQK